MTLTNTPPTTSAGSQPDVNADLGFGSVIARESRRRLLNRDGSFNVRRAGLNFWSSLSAYHYLLTLSWTRFLLLFTLAYIVVNLLFASAYVLAGAGALTGVPATDLVHRFLDAFFFSVHTLGTIGYGNISPATLAANVLVTLESLVGILGIALATGLIFARFSRPVAQIIFSRSAIIAPYRQGRAFMFRIANQRSTQIIDLQARVLLSWRKPGSAAMEREFVSLPLERERVVFFPLSWTIVHPIDESSPLFGVSEEMLDAADAEFLILLSGFDETFSQVVHARSSYKADEVTFGARFKNVINPPDEKGVISVNVKDIDSYERLAS